MNDELRDELIALVEAADLCCPEAVCDAVLAAGEISRAAAIDELNRAKANDASARKSLGIPTQKEER